MVKVAIATIINPAGMPTIAVSKDYRDIKGRGEIAQFILELEIIRKDLVEIAEKMQ